MEINLKIKKSNSSETFNIKIDKQKSVKELRQMVAEQLKEIPEKLKLVYQATILKDEKKIEDYKIPNNSRIVVMISQQKQIQLEQQAQINVNIPQQQKQEKQQNKIQDNQVSFQDLYQQIQQNPQINSLLQNKEFVKQQIKNNPQIKKMIQNNPELQDQLDDENLDQLAEQFADPVKMNEMMQQTNKAVEKLQNTPEGQQLLEKLQTDLEEDENYYEQIKMYQRMKYGDETTNWLPQNQQPIKQDQETQQYSFDEYDDFPATYCSSLVDTLEKSKYTINEEEQKPQQQQNQQQQQQGQYKTFQELQKQYDQQYRQQFFQNQNSQLMQQYLQQFGQDELYQLKYIIDDPQLFNQYFYNSEIRQIMEQQGMNDPELARQQFQFLVNQLLQNQQQQQQQQFQNNSFQQNQQNQQQQQQGREVFDQLRQKYATQLQQIKDMGIQVSDEEILQFLELFNGDVQAVINQIFQ